MDPRLKASLLWGLVGAMTFVVLVRSYDRFTVASVDPSVQAGVALVVGLVAAGATYVAEGWLQSRRAAADRNERV